MRQVLILILFVLAIQGISFGQISSKLGNGSITGGVWDEHHTIFLRAATVAIYLEESSELIAYRLTNNYGDFSYTGLPLDTKLVLIASFIGYSPSKYNFVLQSDKEPLNLGKINLKQSSTQLEEVRIIATPPPVVMKGDTLEFNADAFKLDPNAQTEDLLRALPGITVWSDATITINGREVKSVLVNGKPFFGGDSRIATQNIPKNAVDKIQVYRLDKRLENLSDSTTEMNIKLKKSKSIGYFGKISGGSGTARRFDGEVNLNMFNNDSQIGFALVRNNVNKVASDLNYILRNSTYTGGGATVENEPDFTLEGFHTNTSGGVQFQHDFIKHPDFYNNNRLNGSYFMSNNRKDMFKNTTTITTLGDGNYFQQDTGSDLESHRLLHNFKSIYEKLDASGRFKVSADYSNMTEDYTKKLLEKTSFKLGDPRSENLLDDQGQDIKELLDIAVIYRGNSKVNIQNWHYPLDLTYNLKIDNQTNNKFLKSTYESFFEPLNNVSYDRKYDNSLLTFKNSIEIYLPNFSMLLPGNIIPEGYKIGYGTKLSIDRLSSDNKVFDRLPGEDVFINHLSLTNKRNQIIAEAIPYLNISKNIYRLLSSRYEKNFTATVTSELEFNRLSSKSENIIQNLERHYSRFNPKINIVFSNKQFGIAVKSISFNLGYTNQYPTVEQLAPLVDSINRNQIYVGNIGLKPQRTAEMKLSYDYVSDNSTNMMAWSASIKGGYTNHYITIDNRIDELGRIIFSSVNANGREFIGGSINVKKAYRFKNHQLQISASPTINSEQTPNMINGTLYKYTNFYTSYDPTLSYNWINKLDVYLSRKGIHNNYVQQDNRSSQLKSYLEQSEMSISVNFVKNVRFKNTVIYNRNFYNRQLFNDFLIWNAYASYRFLKSKTAEIKLSGLDLLAQNKGLINYGFNNSITQGSVNALQRYILLSLSYYPRKFGK